MRYALLLDDVFADRLSFDFSPHSTNRLPSLPPPTFITHNKKVKFALKFNRFLLLVSVGFFRMFRGWSLRT